MPGCSEMDEYRQKEMQRVYNGIDDVYRFVAWRINRKKETIDFNVKNCADMLISLDGDRAERTGLISAFRERYLR